MSSAAPTPAASRPRESIEIGRRTEADREQLDAMYANVFGEAAAEESNARWRWQYEENPNRPPEGPEIWVAREGDRVLGQYATMPVRLKVLDRVLRASWGMDVMVGPNLQRRGIGSRLFLYWDRQVEASLGLGLSVASYTLFKKLDWEDVGPVPCFSRALDVRRLLERRLGSLLAAVVAPFVRFFLWLVLPIRKTRDAENVEVRSIEAFSDDYDDLWERAAPAFDFITERKARYLEWKYERVPYVRYDVLEARRDSELTGYCVLRIAERNGVKLALLVDLFAHPEDKASIGALLDHALSWARERGAARMQTFTFDRRFGSRLAHKGFARIASPMQFCVRIHSDHVDDMFFRDTSRWHVSFGDSDQDRDA